MPGSHGAFLLVISDREALGWILREQRTAFPAERQRMAWSLEPGDRMVLYTTRGCFRNPSLDRGRVIATPVVTTPVRDLVAPVVFGDRSFTAGCDLVIERLAPFRQGPELGLLVPRLHTFTGSWPMHLRGRAVVRLDDHDYGVLERELSQVVVPREAALPAYLDHAVPVDRRYAARGRRHGDGEGDRRGVSG
jgi:hypothetical protein